MHISTKHLNSDRVASGALRVDEVVNTNDMILTCGAPSITTSSCPSRKPCAHQIQDVLIRFEKISNKISNSGSIVVDFQ